MSSQPDPAAGVGFLLSDDLLFTSRISGTARGLGLSVKPARSVEALRTLLGQECPRCVLVDLANPGLQLVNLIRHLRETCSPRPRVVAYGSHVDTATLRAAREAGCDLVLPRSKFIDELPHSLPTWLTPRGHDSEKNDA